MNDKEKQNKTASIFPLALGLYDDPENQDQDDYLYDLHSSNLAIFGSAMSGKTSLLKTILLRIHQMYRFADDIMENEYGEEKIYVLDYGNNLLAYKDLPLVAASLSATVDENVRRIFRIMEDIHHDNLAERRRNLGNNNKDKKKQSRVHTTFIIDGLDNFMEEERYTHYQDSLIRIAREALSCGITIIFTATQLTGKIMKLKQSFESVVAFDLPHDAYASLFAGKISKPIKAKGRGIVINKGAVHEFQAYLPYAFGEKSRAEEISEIKTTDEFVEDDALVTDDEFAVDGEFSVDQASENYPKEDVTEVQDRNLDNTVKQLYEHIFALLDLSTDDCWKWLDTSDDENARAGNSPEQICLFNTINNFYKHIFDLIDFREEQDLKWLMGCLDYSPDIAYEILNDTLPNIYRALSYVESEKINSVWDKYPMSEVLRDTFIEVVKKRYNSRRLRDHPDYPTKFTLDTLTEFVSDKENSNEHLVVGMDYYTFDKISIDRRSDGAIAIFGTRKEEKINLLGLLINQLLDSTEGTRSYDVLVWDDGYHTIKNSKIIPQDLNTYYVYKSIGFYSVLNALCPYDSIIDELRAETLYQWTERYKTEKDNELKNVKVSTNDMIVIVNSRESFFSKTLVNPEITLLSSIVQYNNFQLEVNYENGDQELISKKLIFIFTNVPSMSVVTSQEFFSFVSEAFLLDDIDKFVAGPGSNTPFAVFPVKELREMFGLCDEYEGFYINTETLDLHKVKFLYNQK